ncbi:AGC/PKA protein kinase [Edhazardia aedis USNM 41457]|uniref:cAMP-dependent protein kinase n=1 Tax=Edhazardia aedis (strain USNM 41457) TaxID=1003232 RepID=J9DK25_EDHAE|nr:AGC/PKA protein kinase [Edhazardia aedis USNM 41457]|eukprot:EJW02965.1 AGC/PKA protein kinase [Edhazardia aedis USNM 41457]
MFTLRDFHFIKLIGAGTFGRVYIVQLKHKNSPADKYYALKMLKRSLIVKLKQVTHTKNEKDILVQCRGCNFIVKLISTFVTENHFCMLMEYVSGGELFSWLRKRKRLDPYTVRFYGGQIILALEFLHQRNIIFRDLKPENVLVGKDGYIKLTDFGFAKCVEKLTYTVCGTPEYMAPEELDSDGHGREVDFWSLGILFYEMAVGLPPFYADTNEVIYEKICNEEPRFPSFLEPALLDLIKRLLIKDPRYRIGGIIGIREIKNHSFFYGFDWDDLEQKKMQAPIIPQVRFNGDTSNFIEYNLANEDAGSLKTPFVKFRFDP